jgi:hypothetical protein
MRSVPALAWLAWLLVTPVPISTEAFAGQQPLARTAPTGALVVDKRDKGHVTHTGSFDTFYAAVLRVAEAQGDVIFVSPFRITVGVGAIGPLGEQAVLSITLLTKPDGGAEARIASGETTPSDKNINALVKTFVDGLKDALSGVSLSVDPTRAYSLLIYVYTDPLGPELALRRRATAAVNKCLESLAVRRVSTAARERASVWLEVVSRVEGEGLTVRLTVPKAGYSTEWSHDSALNSGMASEVTNLFAAWLNVNRPILRAGFDAPPAQAVQAPAKPARAPSVPSGSSQALRLFLGPAPTAHGLVNVNADFGRTYNDLRDAYSKGDSSFRSVLALVDNRDAADLILEVTFRNDPFDIEQRQIRATLTLVGSPLHVDMNGRAGISSSLWRPQAEGLLRQTVDWVNENRSAIDAVRASRAAGGLAER